MTQKDLEYARMLEGREAEGDALSVAELRFLRTHYTRMAEPPASTLPYVSLDQQDPRLVDVRRGF